MINNSTIKFLDRSTPPSIFTIYTLEDWQKTWMNDKNETSIFISALNKENLEEFIIKVQYKLYLKKKTHLKVPYLLKCQIY